jgi:hypothetical protein
MPTCIIAHHENIVVRKPLTYNIKKCVGPIGVTVRSYDERAIALYWVNGTINIHVLSYAKRGDNGTKPTEAPAIGDIGDSAKTSLVKKHNSYLLISFA